MIQAADFLLPETSRIHGRTSAPGAHRWYLANPIPVKTEQFKDQAGNTLVELSARLDTDLTIEGVIGVILSGLMTAVPSRATHDNLAFGLKQGARS